MHYQRASVFKTLQDQGWASIQLSPNPTDIMTFSQTLGRLVHQQSRPQLSILKPIEKDMAQRNTASAKYALGRFPFHTDLAHWPLPPRYVIMGNGNSISHTPTLLLDIRACRLIDDLSCDVGRGIWNISQAAHPFACSLLLTQKNPIGIRWDSNVMTPLNETAVRIQAELFKMLELKDPSCEIEFKWNIPGRCVIIDNWRVLHARPSISPNEKSRTLYRTFVLEIEHDQS